MTPLHRFTGQPSDSRGQALVEFALVIPVFLLIVFGTIQMGMLLGSQDALTNGVREATRYAATVPVSTASDTGSCSSGLKQVVFAKLQSALQQKLPGFVAGNLVGCGTTAATTTITYCRLANPVPAGQPLTYSIWVQVRAIYNNTLYVPLFPTNLRATASEQMRVETFNLSDAGSGSFSLCS